MKGKSILNYKKVSLVLLCVFCIILLGLKFYVQHLENTRIFFPQNSIEHFPTVNYEEVHLSMGESESLYGWFLQHQDSMDVMLFLHGNSGNIGDFIEDTHDFYHQLKISILLVDYRGFGKSTGSASEGNMYEDAQVMYDYLWEKRSFSIHNIIIFGESLGGSIAVHVASKNTAKALIVKSSFDRFQSMAKDRYPFLPLFFSSVKMESDVKISAINTPKLIIHSRQDQVVPYKFGRALFKSAKEPKYFYEFSGGHSDFFNDEKEKYIQYIKDFLRNI